MKIAPNRYLDVRDAPEIFVEAADGFVHLDAFDIFGDCVIALACSGAQARELGKLLIDAAARTGAEEKP